MLLALVKIILYMDVFFWVLFVVIYKKKELKVSELLKNEKDEIQSLYASLKTSQSSC